MYEIGDFTLNEIINAKFSLNKERFSEKQVKIIAY